MRVFISSTAVDLAPFRKVAESVVLKHGWQPVMVMEHAAIPAGFSVQSCQALVDSCDLFVLLVGHRCGWIPSPEQGGDGTASITQIELASWHARSRIRPTAPPVILMTTDTVPEQPGVTSEDALHAASQLVFRERLKRCGLITHRFDVGPDSHPSDLVTREFGALLTNILSKVMAAQASRRVQEAKSNAWGIGVLAFLGGVLLASADDGDTDRNREAAGG